MSVFVKNIFRFVLFILFQVYVLNQITPLHGFISPYLYYLFILWLPFSISRFRLMIVSFLLGLSLDYFMMTPGLHAAACVWIAFLRPFVISILTPKEFSEFSYREPSARAMGWRSYMVYILILTLFHHGYMVFLEWLSFGRFIDFVLKIIGTTGISLLMIITVEFLFPRQLKFRTNTS